MLNNDAFIIVLAYPETIVPHAKERYSKFLRFAFIGSKEHVRAGHAALVLIHINSGVLEYYDFGRYITPEPNGRVRGRETDFELSLPMLANINDGVIQNLDAILKFLATNPKLTHGEGTMYASVCSAVNYSLARDYIDKMQSRGLMRYGAFIKDATNCARFVTDTLIESMTNDIIKKKLIKSKSFTPSTIGNVVIADTENFVYSVSENGEINEFDSTVRKQNRKLFLGVLRDYRPSLEGKILPKYNDEKKDHAKWLGGLGTGAWFELYDVGSKSNYRFRRISPYGNVDCDGIYKVNDTSFDISFEYQFLYNSNCLFFHVEQDSKTYRFDFVGDFKK